MVQYKDDLSFVMADIPGLIEGASEGVGLGHQFLRHVERCRVLVHLVDLSAPRARGASRCSDFDVLNRELAKYSPELAEKPQMVAANKMDLPDARERLEAFTEAMKRARAAVFPLSGGDRRGAAAAAGRGGAGALRRRTDKLHVERPAAARKEAVAKARGRQEAARCEGCIQGAGQEGARPRRSHAEERQASTRPAAKSAGPRAKTPASRCARRPRASRPRRRAAWGPPGRRRRGEAHRAAQASAGQARCRARRG